MSIHNEAPEFLGPVTTKWLNLNTAPGAVAHGEGIMYYNSTYKTFNLYNDNATLDLTLGHQTVAKVYNNTGVALPGGKVVSISGVDGSGFGYVVLTDATNDTLRNATTGLVTADIPNGSYGYVVMHGILRNVDTSAIVVGSPVWVNPAEPGGITATEPSDNLVSVGTVLTSHASTGSILINIKIAGSGSNMWYIEESPDMPFPSYNGPRLATNEAVNGIIISANVNEATGYSITNENLGNAAYAGIDMNTDVAGNIGGGMYSFGANYFVPRLQSTTAMWTTTDLELITALQNTEFRVRLGNAATVSFDDADTDEVFKIESDFQTSFPELTEALILAKGDQSAITKKFVDDNFAERLAENALSTGLHSGGVLSINASTTTFDVSAGSGIIVDNVSDPDAPVITHVSWSAILNTAPTNILTQPVTYISINSGGAIVQSATPPSATDRRNNIYLGVVVHSNNVNVNAINLLPTVAVDVGAQLQDVLAYIGFKSVSGNLITNAGTDLTIQKTAGKGFKAGSNFQTLNTQPHEFTMAALNPVTFRYRNQNGIEDADTTNIDPTTWDNGGVTTSVSGSSKATIQRFFIFPSNIIRVQRGQEVFNNFATAVAIAGSEAFTEETNIAENGLFLGSLVVQRNATDLSDTTKALFITSAGVPSTASVNTTLQAAYNVSTIPQITTDASGGAVVIQVGSGSDVDKWLQGQNTAGTEVFSVTGQGTVNVGASTITATKITNWDNAFGWGDHALAGYIDGSGAANQIPTFSDADTLTSSANLSLSSTLFTLNVGGTGNGTISVSNIGATVFNSATSLDIRTDSLLIKDASGSLTLLDTSTGLVRVGEQFILRDYGVGTYTGTEAYLLSVTSAGLVIETPLSDFLTPTGDGSGLTNIDADTLDTLDSTQFLRSDADDSTSGVLTVFNTLRSVSSNATAYATTLTSSFAQAFDGLVVSNPNTGANAFASIHMNSTAASGIAAGRFILKNDTGGSSSFVWQLRDNSHIGDTREKMLLNSDGNLTITGQYNGSGAGLTSVDAATLDTLDSTQFLRSDVSDIKNIGDLRFFNGVKATFGSTDGLDMDILHDSSNAYFILNGGTNLYVVDNSTVRFTFGRTTGDFTATGTLKTTQSTLGDWGVHIGNGLNNSGLWVNSSNATDLYLRNTSGTINTLLSGDGGNSYLLGNVGVGTTSPTNPFHVYVNSSNTTSTAGARIEQDGVGDAVLNFLLTGVINWNVGIDNTDNKFKVSSSSSGLGSSTQLVVDTSGGLTATGTVTATNFILSSDRRLKTNIKSISADEFIDVNWKTFKFKNNKQKRYGVIAQELEKKHPEFVRTDDEGMKSVAYIDLLIAKIAELEARLEKAGL